jgi:hypothetical protein
MTLEQILLKRYQWEAIVSFRKTYELPSYDGDIDNLRYFVREGDKGNRFRKNFNEAMTIAKEILHYYDGFVEPLGRRLA